MSWRDDLEQACFMVLAIPVLILALVIASIAWCGMFCIALQAKLFGPKNIGDELLKKTFNPPYFR